MNKLINEIYKYAENLRKNEFFDSAIKYYKNYISYVNDDEKGYFGLFLASINCPNDNPHDYIKNLKDDNCFQNIIALEKKKKKNLKLLIII